MRTYVTKFLAAASNGSQFPEPKLPEIAVVGRSNSGKSTLINSLVGERGLARVSKKPGRTRSIVFFQVQDSFLLVDLPGYGYASAPKVEQATWGALVDSYLGSGRPIRGVVTLFDIRREPDEMDFALLSLLRRYHLAWQAVWTKADKLKTSLIPLRASQLNGRLSTPTPGIVFSSKTYLGRESLLQWTGIGSFIL